MDSMNVTKNALPKPGSSSGAAGDKPVAEVVSEPVVSRPVRNLKRPDSEIGQNEHLLSEAHPLSR